MNEFDEFEDAFYGPVEPRRNSEVLSERLSISVSAESNSECQVSVMGNYRCSTPESKCFHR